MLSWISKFTPTEMIENLFKYSKTLIENFWPTGGANNCASRTNAALSFRNTTFIWDTLWLLTWKEVLFPLCCRPGCEGVRVHAYASLSTLSWTPLSPKAALMKQQGQIHVLPKDSIKEIYGPREKMKLTYTLIITLHNLQRGTWGEILFMLVRKT